MEESEWKWWVGGGKRESESEEWSDTKTRVKRRLDMK